MGRGRGEGEGKTGGGGKEKLMGSKHPDFTTDSYSLVVPASW